MSQDERNRRIRFVYAQLKTLAENLPEIAFERDALEFNALVDGLTALGFDAEGFKVSDADLFRPVASVSRDGHETYRDSVEVRFGVFGRRVKALMTYFALEQISTVVDVQLSKNRD